MISVLFSLLVLAFAGIIVPMTGLLTEQSYGSKLEAYITSRNPQNTADVERFALEYEQKHKNFIS
jgi:hypothetical protein